MSIATGTKLGQYEVQDFLGQGAMGLVYRAYHAQLERVGAIKVMQAITPDADSVARFRHEAQAIAKLRHPNIVDVYDFGEFDGTPYMIVEYVAGGSLASRMSHGRLDQTTALKYLRGIAAGLDYAHARGIVHRDVKPANVLLSDEDTAVLADFGLAKLLQGSSLRSMTGVTTGTPAYMAPEQVTGGKVGPASDRYSLATIAYEMLTGVIPFDGEALMELLYAQVHREPAPPSARYPDLGPQVDAVIMRGLAKDPEARWESCTAFVNALESALAAPRTAAAVGPSALAATVSIAKAAPAAGVKKMTRRAPRTEVMPVPSAAARKPWLKRGAVAGAGLLLLVLVLGVCSALTATTLALNPTTAAPGEDVLVTATNVPARQAGSIQLHSVLRAYSFTADGSGHVSTYITLPRDIETGSHTVGICWNSSCHASAALRVVAGTGLVIPTPGGVRPAPSPSPSHSPGPVATPNPTPTAGSGGGSSGGSGGSGGSTPKPTAPPTQPPPNPCPAESPALTSPPATVAASSTVTVGGQGFTPDRSVTVTLSGAVSGSKTVLLSSTGTFTVSFSVPLLATGSARATATDACGRTASRSFTILAGL